MTPGAQILLATIRKARRERITPSALLFEFLIWYLGITDEDIYEVGELLQADIREDVACSPDYAQINEWLRSLFPQRPPDPGEDGQAAQ